SSERNVTFRLPVPFLRNGVFGQKGPVLLEPQMRGLVKVARPYTTVIPGQPDPRFEAEWIGQVIYMRRLVSPGQRLELFQWRAVRGRQVPGQVGGQLAPRDPAAQWL